MTLIKPEAGKRYIVRYKSENMRKPKEMVLDYLGMEYEGKSDERYAFSARPLAGTQTLPKSWVVGLTEVSKEWRIRL